MGGISDAAALPRVVEIGIILLHTTNPQTHLRDNF